VEHRTIVVHPSPRVVVIDRSRDDWRGFKRGHISGRQEWGYKKAKHRWD
jgi:hypothetical protein